MAITLFYILLVLLVTARAVGELAIRLGQPALVGELVAGIILGLLITRYSASLPVLSDLPNNEVFGAITDLGIFFLMLRGGVELQPRELAKASVGAFGVAVGGFAVPLVFGFSLGWAFLPGSQAKLAQCLFIGTALAITAIPVAVRVLMDLGKLNSKPGQMIVAAAVFDDVLSLILLAILVALMRSGEVPDAMAVAVLVLKIVAFFAITVSLGVFVAPRIGRILSRARVDEFEFSALLIAAMAYALLAELLDLHFILGAFIAGLFFSRRVTSPQMFESVKNQISGISAGFLAPVFFTSIGMNLHLDAVTGTPLFLVLLIVVAFVGKLAGSGLVAYALGMGSRDAISVGAGMSGRGAVELVIADVAFKAGLFSVPDPTPPIVANLFSAVVIVAVVTTLATPIILRQSLTE